MSRSVGFIGFGMMGTRMSRHGDDDLSAVAASAEARSAVKLSGG